MNILSSRPGKIGLGIILALAIVAAGRQLAGGYFSPDTNTLRLGNGTFTARFADTQPERIKGLSGTRSLPADQALIFIFDRNGTWKIWMKDMNYSIDIVWLDESRRVIDIVEGASPESYPKEFAPDRAARYVIEFASGTVKDSDIHIGQRADFAIERDGIWAF